MAQSVNLSVSGIYTSGNDMNGLPPGALDGATNVESRYKNTLEPRRGFEGLDDSALAPVQISRLTNFFIDDEDRIIALTNEGDLLYYDPDLVPNPWVAVPGDFSSGIIAPNAINGKSRFIRAGQNLYLTSQDGVRSLSSGASAQTLRAGVPKGLNLEAETNGDTQGFFNNNIALSTTGDLTASGAIITNLADTTGIEIDQYVTGTEIPASLVVQDLTYTALPFGVLGNSITIEYTGGGTAGNEIVTVVGNAISVQIENSVSTATQILTKIQASSAASDLVSVEVSGTGSNAQTTAAATPLAGGLDNTIPIGTKVSSITPASTVIIQEGDTTAGSVTIENLVSDAGIIAGLIVSGQGIPEGAKVVSISGGGPYDVTIDLPAFQTDTAQAITFTAPIEVTMDANALATLSGTPISFYTGSQVGYRMVFGRVETDINGGSITRIGAPSSIAIANNISPYSTNVTVMGTLPKNSENEITFVQLFRSEQTDSIDISPLDQYNLVYERELTPTDFTNRVITIEDTVPDSLKGIPLYAGSDREGILQSNNPPPMCWDMCTFRDFALYANATQPSTLDFTLVSVGAPDGVQIDDEITISGSFLGVPFSRTYTGKAAEDQASQEFAVVTSGTPSQNITDTANSLIRVINYDEDLPIHAILLSSTTDLPGQILLESDDPSLDTFTITADLHQDAYDPELDDVVSTVNTINNGIYVSKSGELEAVPSTNLLRAGDTSADILRVIPLRDYVVVLKTDGIYKVQGLTPGTLICNPFDLTTKIIGAETAVPLNSGVWMLSNQGVVSISDGGVDAKSIPIDDQLNLLINSFLDNLVDVAFAVGYESDRKYILSVPNGNTTFTQIQHIFNYITNSWTTWERNLRFGFIHSNEGRLYISRADGDDNGVSRERKSATYRDYVDEGFIRNITSVDDAPILVLDDVSGIEVGDIISQDSSTFSPILEVDITNNTVTVQSPAGWEVGEVEILSAYECTVTWKQVFGDNPAFVRQFSEGLALFKNTRFNLATMQFTTDFSPNLEEVEVPGQGNGLWGLFEWGSIPWGGISFPETLRFYIPQNKQLGSYIIPSMVIKQGYSNFKFQGLSISYYNVSQEVGK
jgi:hypothetical protein